MLPRVPVSLIYEAFLNAGQQVFTDTRRPVKGALFFALKGPSFDGNTFAEKALEAGCSGAVIDDERYAHLKGTFLVDDVLKSLQDLATYHRRTFSMPVLAITGSNAKTTSKELITAVLSRRYFTLATKGNLNNHIGVPLTLLQMRIQHQIAVIEMGANHQGEIDALCRIAEPTHGLITNIGRAHLEGFGGVEGVKKGKSELYRYLHSHEGKVFVNGDDAVLSELAAGMDRISYGATKLFDVIGKDCTTEETVTLKVTTRYGEKNWDKIPSINTKMLGGYNFINCLAAAAVGFHFGVEPNDIKEALEAYTPEMNRSQLLKTSRNRIILDAYNANPDSMKAAIENFSRHPASEKMVLLGDMFELGDESKAEHQRIVDMLRAHRLDHVLLVGREFAATEHKGFQAFETTAACADYLRQLHPSDCAILIKGSRGMKMETLSEIL